MANVIIRFSIYSSVEKTTEQLAKLLRSPDESTLKGEPIILTGGKNTGKKYKETAYTYIYEIKNVSDIEMCNEKWMKEWTSDIEILCKLHDEYGFNLDLNYEVTVFDYNFPSFYFQPAFSALLAKAHIQFSFYFYND